MQSEKFMSSIRSVLARKLPPVVLRRVFTPRKLSDWLAVRPHPEHDSVVVDLGNDASFAFFLELENEGPFAVEINSAEVILWCCGTQLLSSMRTSLALQPGEKKKVWFKEIITAHQAKQIAGNMGQHQFGVAVALKCQSELEDFFKATGYLGGIGLRFVTAPQQDAAASPSSSVAAEALAPN